jgi:hypothetical protein
MNSDVTVAFTDAHDIHEIRNLTENSFLGIGLNQGSLILDSSCVGGEVVITGVGKFTNNSSIPIGNIDTTALVQMTEITRILGLVQENFRMRDQVYDGDGNLTSAQLRIYASAADAQNDVNPIAEYAMTASFSGPGQCTGYLMRRAA